MPAMPVPVSPVVKKTIPVTLDYSARTESLQNVTLADQGLGLSDAAGRRRRRRRQGGRPALQDRPARLSGGARSGAGAGPARKRGARLCARQSRPWRQAGADGIPGQGLARPAPEHAAAGRPPRSPPPRPMCGPRSSISTIPRSARPFPAASAAIRRAIGTMVSVGGTVLNTLVQLDPIYVTFNPSETDLVAIEEARKAGHGQGGDLRGGPAAIGPSGRTELPQQHRRSVDRHDHRPGHDRQP